MIDKKKLFFLLLLVTTRFYGFHKPKILMVVRKFPRITETFILSQINGLIAGGFDITIWAREGDETNIIQPDITKYDLLQKVRYIDYHDAKNHEYIHKNIGKYDIIYCQYDRIANVFAKIIKKNNIQSRLVTCIRGGSLEDRINKDLRGYRNLFKQVDLILPVCNYYKKILINYGCAKDKVVVHHSAIDCNKFTLKTHKRDKSKKISILTIARLIKSKGLEYGITAIALLCKKYPNITYSIIGGGKEKAFLKKMVRKYRISKNVKILGWKPQNDIINEFRESDIFFLPSIESEGIPNALMEAMASGLPVIGTYLNGIPELINDGVSGLLVEVKNVKQLVEKLCFLIEHPKLWKKFGKNARRYIKKEHNIEIENIKLVNMFKNFISNS